MRTTIILITILFFGGIRLTAQIRTIYGRVIDEGDLTTVPFAYIQSQDKQMLGKADIDGRFKIDIPQYTQTLLFSMIGFEIATIRLNYCDTVEVVMMYSSTYDFMSSRKIDKDRLRRFNKIPELHLQAYNKGLFTKESVCYTREFEPWKPKFDSIEKEATRKRVEIKSTFKKLKVGDTIRIPFDGQFSHNSADSVTVYAYSSLSGWKNFDYIIEGVILSKNTHKRGYNLVYKVINCDLCKQPIILKGRTIKIGEVFTHNMRYYKVLLE
jgi:hypothetical protein